MSGILRRCVVCKRHAGKAFQYPVSPPMPTYRLQDTTPFTIVGVDFTGALLVSKSDRNLEKVYICLFTCATTRAVHLEVVTDLSARTFLNAFRRFAARRSLPARILSDNASTYLASAEEIARLMEDDEVKSYLGNFSIEWTFIPKRAPWFGGFWERLIGITKMCLKKVLGRAHVSLDDLQTIITEIESSMNDRPITYVGEDKLSPLTPSLLMHGHMLKTMPHQIEDEDLQDPDFSLNSRVGLSIRAKRMASLLHHFRKIWAQEYLTSLQERHKPSGHLVNRIKVGDVVLISSEGPRLFWKMAVVKKLLPGGDGLIRSVVVKTSSGITNRPINKLCPLEVSTEVVDADPDVDDQVDPEV